MSKLKYITYSIGIFLTVAFLVLYLLPPSSVSQVVKEMNIYTGEIRTVRYLASFEVSTQYEDSFASKSLGGQSYVSTKLSKSAPTSWQHCSVEYQFPSFMQASGCHTGRTSTQLVQDLEVFAALGSWTEKESLERSIKLLECIQMDKQADSRSTLARDYLRSLST